MRAYLFVDGENHFIRSQAAAEDVIGSPKAAEAFALAQIDVGSSTRFPAKAGGSSRFLWRPDLQLFWDRTSLATAFGYELSQVRLSRAVYSCAFTGEDSKIHQARVGLRQHDFEPIVIHEPKDQKASRDASRRQHGLIEKAKGCDIAIAVRMVADAAADLYDCCYLFTSDADFLPAVEAVRRMGKIVVVFGYGDGVAKSSPYFYVPDRFVNLSLHLRKAWRNGRAAITKALNSLGESGPFNPVD